MTIWIKPTSEVVDERIETPLRDRFRTAAAVLRGESVLFGAVVEATLASEVNIYTDHVVGNQFNVLDGGWGDEQ